MKKATIVFLWIAIISSILRVLAAVLVVAGVVAPEMLYGEGALSAQGWVDIVTYAIAIWFNISTLKVVNNAVTASDIKLWRKILAFLFSTLITAILLCCLKDKHFGYAPAPAAASTEEDAYAKLTKLKNLYESGAISEEEYLAEKAKILG